MSDELRRLANEATPGPWYAEVESEGGMLPTRVGSEGHRRGVGDFAFIFGGVGPDQALAANDARYLAAVSPDVILGLLDRIAEFGEFAGDVLATGALRHRLPHPNNPQKCAACRIKLRAAERFDPARSSSKVEST